MSEFPPTPGERPAAHLRAAAVLLEHTPWQTEHAAAHVLAAWQAMGDASRSGIATDLGDRLAREPGAVSHRELERAVRALAATTKIQASPARARIRRPWVWVAVAAVILGAVVSVFALRLGPASTPAWRVQYYPDSEFSGDPVVTSMGRIQADWGEDAPEDDVPADGFFLVAETCLTLSETEAIQLQLTSDDGSRMFIDGALVLDNWGVHGARAASRLAVIRAGMHHVRVVYFDDEARAMLEVGLRGADGRDLSESLSPPDPEGEMCGRRVEAVRLEGGRAWRGQYFPNVDFTGTPLVRADTKIAFNWGRGSPAESVPADRFSVRWDTCMNLVATEDIDFELRSDDGSRLFVDGVLQLDNWGEHGTQTKVATVRLLPGSHHFRVDYFEQAQGAQVRLHVRRPDRRSLGEVLRAPEESEDGRICGRELETSEPSSAPVWNREMYPTTDLTGEPVSEVVVSANEVWGDRAPAPDFPENGFSARFVGCLRFDRATDVRLRLESDDGSRLLIAGRRVIDNWGVHGLQVRYGEASLAAGTHLVMVEYFNDSGHAELRVHMAVDEREWTPLDGRWMIAPSNVDGAWVCDPGG